MDLGLQRKVAIVTGGGTGIGAGICEALAQEGVNVAVNWIVGKEDVQAFAGRPFEEIRHRLPPVLRGRVQGGRPGSRW